MIQVRFQAPVLPKYFTPEFQQISEAGIRNVLTNYSAKMQTNRSVPIFTGALAASIPATIDVRDAEHGSVGTPLFYGLVMEKGRAPGAKPPPADALLPWVRLKLRPRPKPAVFRRRLTRGSIAKQAREMRAAGRSAAEIRTFLSRAKFAMRAQRGARFVGALTKKGRLTFKREFTRKQSHERSVAFAVARSIGKNGIKVPLRDGRGGMFDRTYQETKDRFERWYLEPFKRGG